VKIIAGQHEQIKAWLDQGLTVTKVPILLGRRGVVVSYRTLHRYATTELGFGQRKTTVRVADCAPGAEVQVDFGRLGMLTDAGDGRRRVVGIVKLLTLCGCCEDWSLWRLRRGTRATGIRSRSSGTRCGCITVSR
jgi:hypothetical protein